MGRKTLTKFDMEKDEWYYQPKIYINRQDADSTYSELKNFRLWANQGAEEELMDDRMVAELSKKEPGQRIKRLKVSPDEKQSQDGMGKVREADGTDGFFDGKTQLLKDEIEDINRNLEKRVKIKEEFGYSIDFEIKEIKRHLHEIYTWKKGDKSTIEFIRMEFLKLLAALYREKRSNCLGYWKDSVFEKRDRRELLFEYKSLAWTNDLASEKKAGGEEKS
ncbi:MAG: hypothetical protein PVH61_00075 [Candidatus Aminicenantes bacterium]